MSCQWLASAQEVILTLRVSNYTAYIFMQLKSGTKPSAVKTEGLAGDRMCRDK